MNPAIQPSEEIPNHSMLPASRVHARDLHLSYDDSIDWMRAYCAYFHVIPSCKSISGINCKKAIKWIETELAERILKKHSNERYSKRTRNAFHQTVAYVMKDGLLIFVNGECDRVEIFFSGGPDCANELLEKIRKFVRKKSASNISLIINGREGLELKTLKNKKPLLQLNENYNDDLVTLHTALIKNLKVENSSGLILFHGIPGTGKSTYIRYLISLLKKEVIFLSPRMAGNLDDPGFVKLLTEHPNSIIIIEDAEELLVSRNTEKNSGISTLLNLTDGLLGTSLGIQFICTFNTPVSNIDKALLRKGRLVALYEFGALSIEKSEALLNNLGVKDFMVSQPMTLAEIFHVSDPEFQLSVKRNPIGFDVARVA